MNDDLYLVRFHGDIDERYAIDEVKRNLTALFKAPPEKIDRLFSGAPAVIKNNVDRATALKYQAAMKKAGAICLIIPVKPADTKPLVSDSTDKSGLPKVITVKNVRGNLAYSPILCNLLSGNESSFNLNRPNIREVPFSSIRLISVFREQPEPEGPATDSLALFLEHSKRPFLVETNHIRFNEFPDVPGQNSIRSVQNFIKFLSRQNTELRIDHKTERFLRYSEFIVVGNQLDHLTSLGEALET